jgi:hypothetical protein
MRNLSQPTLEAVRGRIGVEDNEADTSRDAEIMAMPAREIVRKYFGWHMGYEEWGSDAIRVVEEAYGIRLKEPKA